jgi:dCMP deaminase
LIISWDEFFMGVADLAAKRSKDPSMQVGACIANNSNRVTGVGYNGMPLGNDNFPWTRPEKHGYVIHAEVNAILNASETKDCRLYVLLYPCQECAKIIIQSGITEVIYKNENKYDSTIPQIMFSNCCIGVRCY